MWLIGGIIICIVLVLAIFSDVRRFATMGVLILKVQPYEQTVPGAPVILIAGDSTGYGTGASRGAKSVAGYLGTDYSGYTIKNISVNGRTIEGLKNVFQELPAEQQYHLIVLQIGGNDIIRKRPVGAIEADLRTLLTEANKRAKHVVMMTAGNVGAASAFVRDGQPDSEYEALTRVYREMVLRVTPEYNVPYVDLFLEPEDDVYLKEPKKYLAPDGLHPSSYGYYYWYQSLQPVIDPVLQ